MNFIELMLARYNIYNFKKRKGVYCGNNFKFGKYYNLILQQNSFLAIGNSVEFREFWQILVYANARIEIGDNVFFNSSCSINAINRIHIGENSIFGEGVKIYDHNHFYSKNDSIVVSRNEFTSAPVKIGKNCWIGSNVTILKGVEIGDNVVIGANSLIYKSILPNSIVKTSHQLIVERK